MFQKKNKSIHPILKHSPFLGSGGDKMIHSTENPCPEAYLIPIDSRWYIRSIPEGGGYLKCRKCFPSVQKEENVD
jgi:hypothetical protein